MSTTPPGWYDDGHGAQRWWDGAQWTEHTQAPDAAAAPLAPVAPEAAATAAPRSRLWIVWTVLGIVVAAFVALAIVLVTVIVGFARSTEELASSAESGSVAAVRLYDDAWNGVDCDAFQRSTTLAYREGVALTDCADFEEDATAFADSSDDYDVEIVDVERQSDGSVHVTTVETYLSDYDENGDALDEPVAAEDHYRYIVVLDGDTWAIDELEND